MKKEKRNLQPDNRIETEGIISIVNTLEVNTSLTSLELNGAENDQILG